MNYKRHVAPNSKLGRCGATGKVIFRTEGAAKKRIKEILLGESNRCHDYMRAFRCWRCGYWHLTSKVSERTYPQPERATFTEHPTFASEKSKAFSQLANAIDGASA